MNPESAKNRKSEIWAIASGKGGTGKSFITSSLGTHLAVKGCRVIMIDADLGGANLHTILGINKPKNSLTDFFERKVPLSDVIVECGVPNLRLISGLLNSLNSENINYAQKLKFFRHIKNLDADYILIDLGAGSHMNTIDTFLLADTMIVVTNPEITALENMYHFIKNVYFRKLKRIMGEHSLKETVQAIWINREAHSIRNFNDLLAHLSKSSPYIKEVLDKEMADFLIQIVVNQTRSSRDVEIGINLKSLCLKFLGLSTVYAGHIDYDECVTKCVNRKERFIFSYAFSNAAKQLGLLSDVLRDGRTMKMPATAGVYVDRGI